MAVVNIHHHRSGTHCTCSCCVTAAGKLYISLHLTLAVQNQQPLISGHRRSGRCSIYSIFCLLGFGASSRSSFVMMVMVMVVFLLLVYLEALLRMCLVVEDHHFSVRVFV